MPGPTLGAFNIFHVILISMGPSPYHRKPARSPAAAERERTALHHLRGPGVVPARDGPSHSPAGPVVTSRRAHGSLADVLACRRTLTEAECRGVAVAVGAAVGHVHARGWVHGDVKPANVLLAPGHTVWLADFDAAGPAGRVRRRGTPARGGRPGPLRPVDDVVALLLLTMECATGVLVDPRAGWPAVDLTALGCPPRLAADLATLLAAPPSAAELTVLLDRGPTRLPPPPTLTPGHDPTPTVDFESNVIEGLSPAVEREGPAGTPPAPSGRARVGRPAPGAGTDPAAGGRRTSVPGRDGRG